MTTSFPPTIPGDAMFSNVQANSHIKLPTTLVEQATNATTAVTSNNSSVIIVTQSVSTAAASAAVTTFAFNNTHIGEFSNVQATIVDYSGTLVTNGVPMVTLTDIAAGTVNVNITNCHPTNALSGTLRISIMVVS